MAGWTTGTGALVDTFGGLVLAAHRPDSQLVHIGNVGTGFTMAARRALRIRFDEMARVEPLFALPALRGGTSAVHFVEPALVGSVEYREYSGGSLRHPQLEGITHRHSTGRSQSSTIECDTRLNRPWRAGAWPIHHCDK
ncbi:hypothetical protein ACFWPH_28750 [Nocardia sp. NPDC058499]|uniref:ATP dependent DNA ligase n=1 Tax=Nocardia sp. NPDC058499 TaxID=3346530 RepID=UPI003649ACAF